MLEERSSPEELDFALPDWMDDDPQPLHDPSFLVFGEEPLDGRQSNGPKAFANATPRRRNVYRSSEWTRVSPHVFRCRVTVGSANGDYAGEAEGPEVPGVRAEISARATIDALNKSEEGDVILALKGARVLRVFETPLVVVAMYALNDGETTSLVGACMVHNSVEQATIQATLQAADRWLTWQAHRKTH